MDKKEAIFKAALDLIAENGFHNSPMSVLAKRANVAAGTIYHYFSSKEELIAELYSYLKHKVSEKNLPEDDTSKSFKERFKKLFFGFYQYFLNNSKEFVFLEQFNNSVFLGKNKDEIIKIDQIYIEFLRKGVVTSNLRDMPTKLHLALFNAQISAIVKLSLRNELLMDDTNINAAFNSCWEGLRKN